MLWGKGSISSKGLASPEHPWCVGPVCALCPAALAAVGGLGMVVNMILVEGSSQAEDRDDCGVFRRQWGLCAGSVG